MSDQAHCPKCGTQLPADAPAGLCPKCLVQAGLESEPSPQANPAATMASPASSRFEPLSVESLAGKFPQLEILELLGKGGMGAVYKARQRGLDRLVAVKVLPPEIGHDPAFAERFTREARALARLSHNHIVSVFDFGQSDGLFYIVMEYVDGVNLRQTIQAGKLTPAEALAIVPQICEALQFAHDEGIVHRDIKPENILIDKRGRVKIADFGLAKLMASGGRESPDGNLTATHQIMGTLRYMAPEQMLGTREVDHRADIYSLGVIFYELLTGELPMGKFAPPSNKVQIDVRLDEIVLRALEQHPEQRYQHASEVKTDVDAVVSGKHIAPSAANRASGPILLPDHTKGEATEHRLVQAPADCLLLAAGIAFVTACGVAAWLVATASPENNNPTTSIIRGNLTGMSVGLATYSLFIGGAGLMLRRLQGRLVVLLVNVIVGLFFPAVVALNVLMELRNIPVWPAVIPLWIGMPAAMWVVITLFRDDVRRAFDAVRVARGRSASVGPGSATGLPETHVRFLINDSSDVARQAKFHFSTLGYHLIEQRPDVCIFERGSKWAGLWAFDVRRLHTILTVRTAPAAGGGLWVSCNWSLRKLGSWVLPGDIAKLEAEGHGLEAVLTPKKEADVASSSHATALPSPAYPKLVPVIAVFNLVGAIVLMLASWMESPAELAKPMPRLWEVWEQVDAVLGFVMAAGMFAASIGLFLWKPWARKLTLGVCIFGLASLVFDAPYLARFAIPDIYTDIEQEVIAEGIERDVRDFVTLATFLVVFGGLLAFGLACLIGQIIYFTRPRVVAAFESQGEKHGKFSEWLFSGIGAVVGVIGVFGPLALLLGIAALLSTGGATTVKTTMKAPAPPPPLGTITSGIGVNFIVPAGQVAVFEIVTRRDNATVPIPSHSGYVMAADKPVPATFLWSHVPNGVAAADGRRSWRIEVRYAGGGETSTGGFLLPEGLDSTVGSKSLGLGLLEPSAEIVSWCGYVDATKLPENGAIGLRVTIVPHGLNRSGSGAGHIDWKTEPPPTTTRRKLPPAAAETETNRDSQWARQLAESYLQAAGSNNADEPRVMSWLSESFKKRFQIPGGIDTWVYYRFKSYVISTQELGPTQDEAILKGTLEATERHKYERLGSAWRDTPEDFAGTVRFTLRLVKDKDNGRWRVDLIQFDLPSDTTPTRGDREKTKS